VTVTLDITITAHISVRLAKQKKEIAESCYTLKQHHNLRDGSFGGRFLLTE
jgi:hypothetical protein